MKKLEKALLVGITIGFLSFIAVLFTRGAKETRYCGKVTKLYFTPAGYKTRSEKHVIFYNDSLKRYVDIEVTNQCYANVKEGESVCFDLTEGQLRQ